MKIESYKRAQAGIAAAVAVGVAIAVTQDSITLAAGTVLIGMLALFVAGRKVEGKVADEMAFRMAEKAAYRAFQLFTVSAAGLAIVSMATDWLSWIPGIEVAGQTLAYSALALLAVYALFYGYYNRRGLK